MLEYEIKDAKTANLNEIFFNKNTNKMSYKNSLGIVTILSSDDIVKYVLRSFTQSIGSNSTGETQLLQLTIPANSFKTTDKFSFFAIFSKTAAEQGITLRVKVSTSASMPLGNTDTIAFAAPGLTTRFVKLNRDMIINGGNLKGFGFTTSVITDQAASSLPLSSVSFDVTQIHYLYVSVQPAATTTDVTFLEAFEIKNL
jgi:hypothetical protein